MTIEISCIVGHIYSHNTSTKHKATKSKQPKKHNENTCFKRHLKIDEGPSKNWHEVICIIIMCFSIKTKADYSQSSYQWVNIKNRCRLPMPHTRVSSILNIHEQVLIFPSLARVLLSRYVSDFSFHRGELLEATSL